MPNDKQHNFCCNSPIAFFSHSALPTILWPCPAPRQLSWRDGSLSGTSIDITGYTLPVPEPTTLGLLVLGGLLAPAEAQALEVIQRRLSTKGAGLTAGPFLPLGASSGS